MAGGIMVIIDGLDDIPYKVLQNKTPLEFGKGNSFKEIEKHAVTGEFQTIPNGIKADTMAGVLSLLGVTPHKMPPGRSYLEAIAQNVPFANNDLVLRGNFAKVNAKSKRTNAFATPGEDTVNTAKKLFAKHGFALYPVGEYRNIIVAKEGAKYLKDLQTFEPHENIGGLFDKLLPTGNALGKRFTQVSRELLQETGNYTILPWGQSVFTPLPKFPLSAAVVHNTSVIAGIAKLMGIKSVTQKGFTGETDTDLRAKAKAAIALFKEHRLVIVHVAGTDEATHRQNPIEKANFTQRIDKELLGGILPHLKAEEKLLVTSDHWALCRTGGHLSDPVGFYLYQKNLSPKNVGLVSNEPAHRLVLNSLQ